MPRLMAVSLTEAQVVARTKTVTRRLGWRTLLPPPGARLTLCRKVMGRRRGDGTVDPLVRLAEVEVVDVRTEPLCSITAADVVCEGFPWMTPDEFVAFFVRHMRCDPDTLVTRIEWYYLDVGVVLVCNGRTNEGAGRLCGDTYVGKPGESRALVEQRVRVRGWRLGPPGPGRHIMCPRCAAPNSDLIRQLTKP